MVQTIKDINMQVIEDPSLTKNIGSQSAQSGEVIVTSVIAIGDLELPSGMEKKKKKKIRQNRLLLRPPLLLEERERKLPNLGLQVYFDTGSPSPPPTKSKRLRKRIVEEYVAPEGTGAVPTTTSGTDDELREAFEAVEQEKEPEDLEEVREGPEEKVKTVEEEEIPAEVIAESIDLAQKQQEQQEDIRAGLTSSELALFEDPGAEHSTAVPAAEEQTEQSTSEPVEQAELPAAPELMSFQVEVPRSAGVLAVMTSPLKPPIVAMPIHSLPGSSATASFADPELAEFEAMDLDAQLDRLEMLSSPIGKAKSKAVEEIMKRLKIWQSTELELDEDREAIDQLMKDLDLLHR
ncbi:unnamed protein product [Prunus armeniaca]